jgi:hypothetical protein
MARSSGDSMSDAREQVPPIIEWVKPECEENVPCPAYGGMVLTGWHWQIHLGTVLTPYECNRYRRLWMGLDPGPEEEGLPIVPGEQATEEVEVTQPAAPLPAGVVEQKAPPLVRQVVRFSVEIAKWLAAGSPIREPEEIDRIKAICLKCPLRMPLDKPVRCSKCGCYFEGGRLCGGREWPGMWLMATKHCPLSKEEAEKLDQEWW